MKVFIVTAFYVLVLLACNSEKEKEQEKSIVKKETAQQPPSLELFADSVVRLDKFALASVDKVGSYFTNLVPADSVLADSAAVLFLRHISFVIDTTNQLLFKDTTDYFDLIYNNNPNAPAVQKEFQQRLQSNHILIKPDGEGSVYAIPDYDWINHILLPKTSTAVDRYLELVSKEEKNPTLLDAGLAVEPKELVDRAVSAENLLEVKLPLSFATDVKQKHQFYTSTLLFGSVNSPAIEYNPVALVTEYKKGYDYLLTTYPASKIAQLIAEWQTIVKAKNNGEIEKWRKKYLPYYE